MSLAEQNPQYHMTKVQAVVPGGDSGKASIYNGLDCAHALYPDDSVVLIHDGVRPLINEQIISDDIACVLENGSAITVSPDIETIVMKQEDGHVGEIVDRSCCEMAKAP